jgi:error-prone DNA polymerase
LPDEEAVADLPLLSASEHVVADYQTLKLSLKDHPMRFLRRGFRDRGVQSCLEIARLADRTLASVAGVVLVRQRPGGGKVCFITLEDETGVANLVVMPEVFAKHRKVIMTARLMRVEGRIQRSPEGIVHLQCWKLFDHNADLARLNEPEQLDFGDLLGGGPTLSGAHPGGGHRHPRDVRIIPKSRDFH